MNHFGTLFSVNIYGESHGKAVGVVVDGMKPGISFNESLLLNDLSRRKAGAVGTTKRIEADEPQILSGVYRGYTTGAPIHILFENTNTKSEDYQNLLKQPRPGHADFTSYVKYKGFADQRGGGHFSGRLTTGIVAAGAFAKMLIPAKFESKLVQVGDLTDMNGLDEYLKSISEGLDSVGGIVEVKVSGLEIGIGEPFFDSVESKIAHMVFSVPAIKGIEFGIGFKGIQLKGSEFNDQIIDESGKTKTNHNGGLNGGITNGNDLVVRVFVKPASSIFLKQDTFDFESKSVKPLQIVGRHDACIARRAVVVIENAIAIALADLYLQKKSRE
ncbi:chorismate synthase [Acholeplasma vituli]|uniref:Chorismate synthase n=1 Tax=Paracholeplasma vituli TaxID=69473 RepID=A0ABT2PTT9_9MOLU|nr:chorismate synthase [Paracholeplasma vituli]MCU0104370.1 chorismate synthase [Paracholeplasma vituli]